MSQWTKKAMMDSFGRFIKERPLDKITVKDIVDDCAITRNTFYYYFEDIFALANEVLRERLALLSDQSDQSEGWDSFLLLLARQVAGNSKTVLHLFRSSKSQAVNRFMNEILQAMMEQLLDHLSAGRTIPAEKRTLILDFYRYALVGLTEHWVKSDMQEDPEQLAHQVSDLLKSGMQVAIDRHAQKA